MGTAGSWLYSDNETPVVLRLNDVRNVRLKAGEELAGVITLRRGDLDITPGVVAVRRESPAMFAVEVDTILTLEIRIKRIGEEGPCAVVVGGVCLPLEHLAKRCGQSVYHTWFPLQQPPPTAGNSDTETLDQLDRAMRGVARDPRMPMVCISLYPASTLESTGNAAGDHRYELSVPAGDKSLRFLGLEQSHIQHVRLLQSLYRSSRQAKQEASGPAGGPGLLDNSVMTEDSYAPNAPGIVRANSDIFDLPGPAEVLAPNAHRASQANGGSTQEAIARLQREIETTTAEANLRINQASDAIRTLKERLGARQAEHEHLRQETVRLQHDADALGIENERLAIQLERKARERAADTRSREDREQELKRLRREADMLKEQKEALMNILEDLYGAKAQAGMPGQGAWSNNHGGPDVDGGEEGAFENMLPRPSELFEGGVLEDTMPVVRP